MPKISKKKMQQIARAKNIPRHTSERMVTSYPHYHRKHYHKTDIELWIDLDGTLWEYARDYQPKKPPLINDFLTFCIRSCLRVYIFTARDKKTALPLLEEYVDQAILSKIKLKTCKHLVHLHRYKFKVIPYEKFNAFNTLILDDQPSYYPAPQISNVVSPEVSGEDRSSFYNAVVDLIDSRRRNHSIMMHAKSFCKEFKGIVIDNNAAIARVDRWDRLQLLVNSTF